MKNAVTGGMTEQEVRNLLLKRGVMAFKTLAGSLPQKESKIANFDDLPMFWFDRVEHWSAWYRELAHSPRNYMGQMVGILIRLDMLICWECNYALRDYITQLSPTLSLYAKTHEGYCELCGEWENDYTPR